MKPDTYARSMSEADLQEGVRQLAVSLGIRYYHTHDSRHSPAGFPDVVLVSPPNCLIRELKREGVELTDAQLAWLADLFDCDLDVGVWKPADWISGRIVDEMRAMRGKRR